MHSSVAFISLISLGFFGGFSHCIGMCSPFVLSQSYEKIKRFNLNQDYQISKIKSSLLLPYHFGRIITYSLIAAILSQFTKIIENYYFQNFSALLMLLAIIMIIKSNFPQYFVNFKAIKINPFSKIIIILSNKTKNLNGFFLGITLGFLPCGLVYAALMIAISSGNPFISFILMFSFGLSTIPALLMISYSNNILMNSRKKYLDFLILLAVISNIVVLIFYILKIFL